MGIWQNNGAAWEDKPGDIDPAPEIAAFGPVLHPKTAAVPTYSLRNHGLWKSPTVNCPDDWTLSASYHSHPYGSLAEEFSGTDPETGGGDYPYVNQDGGVPLYLGTPSGKVKRLDKDEDGKDKDKPHHPGVEVPDNWGYEEKWKKR